MYADMEVAIADVDRKIDNVGAGDQKSQLARERIF